MKNFFKKLSFVLAIAMVLTSIAPATASAAVSEKNVPVKKVNVKYDGEKVDSINLDVEETKTIKLGLPVTKAAKAAGFTKTTFATAVKVADDSVVEVVKVSKRLYEITGVAAGETTITFGAAKTKKLAKAGEFKKEATLTVVVEAPAAELTAKQTATNKITVTGADLSANVADYTLKLGTATKTLKNVVEINDAKTVAVIEVASSTLVEGTYTLTFGEASVELACEPSEVASIEFVPEKAIMDAEDESKAVAYFKVFNQFEEDITEKANDLSISGSDGATQTDKGEITFDASADYNLNLSQVSVSIVNKENGVACSKLLTVCEKARLDVAEMAGIYKVTGGTYSKVETLPEGLTKTQVENYYKILVSGVDQYGLEFPVEKLDDKNISLTLSSVTGLTAVVPAEDAVNTTEIDDVEYAIVDLTVNNTENALKAGTVSVFAVVLTSGKTFNNTIEVTDAVKIDSISISAPNGVYAGQSNDLAYTVLDTEGNEITDIDTLCKLNTVDFLKDFNKTAGEGNVYFVGSKDGTAVLKYDLSNYHITNNVNTTQTISWITPTLKYGYQTVTVRPDRKAVAVVGVWTLPETGFNFGTLLATTATSGGSITVNNLQYKYEDQYGNLIQWWENIDWATGGASALISDIAVVSEFDSALPTGVTGTANATGVDMTVGSVSGSSITKIKVSTSITLPGKTNATTNDYTYTVGVAKLDDIAGLGLSTNKGTYYADSADAVAGPTVTGFYAGKFVVLQAADFSVVDVTLDKINPLISGYNVTLEDTCVVVVKNSAGTVLKATVNKSNAPGKVVYASAYDIAPFSNGYATITLGDVVDDFNAYLVVKDQYKNTSTANPEAPADLVTPRVTLSNLPANTDKYELTNNGTKDASLEFKAAGWYTIKANFAWADGYSYDAILVFEVR